MSPARLERVVRDAVIAPSVVRVRGRRRRLLHHAWEVVWSSLCTVSDDSLSMSHATFVRSVRSAIAERDKASCAHALSTKPWLGLYNRVYEHAGLKMYFTRHSDGHRGARARFLFRTGAAFLQHHRRSCHSRPEEPDVACSGCSVRFEDILEGVQHYVV